ncbi:MAG: hypothetical protein IJZ42_01820 [Lachnospiraceae bacterium]|nr:hypothetical protein [Lachnospiraceae bacterium]
MDNKCPRDQDLYTFLKNEYIDNGYLYSGSWPYNSLREKGFTHKDIDDLLEKGWIQKRNCEGLAYELSVPKRHQLLSEHALCSRWMESAGSAFLEEIRAEVCDISLVVPCEHNETMITVDTLKVQGDEQKANKMDVHCPFERGQIIRLEYDLPRKRGHSVGYAGYRPPDQRQAVGAFMVTDILCNLLVDPPMNMIGLQSLDNNFNRLHPRDRNMLLFEDIVIKRMQKSPPSLDEQINVASTRVQNKSLDTTKEKESWLTDKR